MVRKEVLTHLISALILAILISLLNFQLKFSLIFFWLGTILGSFLLDIDHFFYTYFLAPYEFTSQRAKRLF